MRTTSEGLEYPNPFYWDINRNPYASVKDGLADCTCYVYGSVIEDGHRPIVSEMRNANTFQQKLINGWTRMPFSQTTLEVGDVIQWVAHCHVAIYVGDNKISGSFYTGMHGKAYYGTDEKGNKKFDTRSFTSLREMSDWMIKNYPKRFFHCWSIEEENSWVGGTPEYVLKHPLWSVSENKAVDQIYVSADDMNVRNDSNEVLKRAEKGFFNVLGWKDANGYRWYEVEKGKYIANVPSRVTFIPKQSDEVAELQAKIKEYERILKEINSLSGVSL